MRKIFTLAVLGFGLVGGVAAVISLNAKPALGGCSGPSC